MKNTETETQCVQYESRDPRRSGSALTLFSWTRIRFCSDPELFTDERRAHRLVCNLQD